MNYDVVVIGGGAAGFFTAINAAQNNPHLSIAILERSKDVLSKVKVSGGGRCNVTHACFDPKELIEYYPRGNKELLGPFHKFACGDTFEWFENRGINLHIEDDGRVFPSTNSSQTIIDCFLSEAQKLNIDVIKESVVSDFFPENNTWIIQTKKGLVKSNKLVVAAGSSPKVWSMLAALGHTIVNPVPSLFTFNCSDERISDIPGVVVQHVDVEVLGTDLISDGPLLITHWGFSAPSILKLSAFGARVLHENNYQFQIKINFIQRKKDAAISDLKEFKIEHSKNNIGKTNKFNIPKRLWKKLLASANISEEKKWADLSKNEIESLACQLTEAVFDINGKSTFKEEFVTAGGVALNEINFKRFESRLHENLFLAGEVLNIDAVTGGFNFQNAWTGGYMIAQALTN